MATAASDITRTVDLLGGRRTFPRPIHSALEAHREIANGFPGNALTHLVSQVGVMRNADMLEKAVGISLRTLQRRKKDDADKRLSKQQSGRAWKFATILSRATAVFGSQADAERWLSEPALGLDNQRPIDLLDTPAGLELVETFLEQIAYGVYA